MASLDKQWNEAARKLLVGKRVKAVSYMSPKEATEMGWNRRPVVIEFDDGTIVYPSSDDEGNDAGALFTNNDKVQILPVLR